MKSKSLNSFLKLINSDSSFNESINTINGRISFIIKTFLDSPYYYNKKNCEQKELTQEQLGNIANLNKKSTLSISFDNILKKIEEKIKNFNFDYFSIKFHTNERGKEPFIIYENFFDSDENEFILFEDFYNYHNSNFLPGRLFSN